MTLSLNDFDFDVPANLIAQKPLATRHDSRLLVADATTQSLSDDRFLNLPTLLRKKFPTEPILVIANDSKVYPARVRIKRLSGARGEVFILNRQADLNGFFSCLLRPLKKLVVGEILLADNIRTSEDIAANRDSETQLFRVEALSPPRVSLVGTNSTIDDVLVKFGEMPLPPYIVRDPNKVGDTFSQLDAERYQTVFANLAGSQAAPTAGLHFSKAVIDELSRYDISFCHVTLHVGLGTFQPVQTQDIAAHEMHTEYYSISQDVFKKIEQIRALGGKIIFVGTTSLRAVESFYRQVKADSGNDCLTVNEVAESMVDRVLGTNLFVWPKTKDDKFLPLVGHGLLTNFHQPQSTLVMLIAALLKYDFWRSAYVHAVRSGYRFFSYGDASLLIF